MHPAIEDGALDPSLARVALIGLEIEHVVDAVQREVVRDEEEEGAHDEGRVDTARGQQVGRGEGEGRVDPAEGARGQQQLARDVRGRGVGHLSPFRRKSSHRAGRRMTAASG